MDYVSTGWCLNEINMNTSRSHTGALCEIILVDTNLINP